MCLVEDMINTLDDCDLLEKVVNMTNVLEHNDVTVSIKVQQFRCRYAKYVYYNCTRVLCECHGYKRHREPSRIPVKMLKRLSQNSRKLRCYVRSCLSKNVPRSSKVHHLIKNIATRKKSTHKTSSRFAVVQGPGRGSLFIDFKYSELLLYLCGDGLVHFRLSVPFKSGVVLLFKSFQFPQYVHLLKDGYSCLACKHGHLDFLSPPLQATNNLFLLNFFQTTGVRNIISFLVECFFVFAFTIVATFASTVLCNDFGCAGRTLVVLLLHSCDINSPVPHTLAL